MSLIADLDEACKGTKRACAVGRCAGLNDVMSTIKSLIAGGIEDAARIVADLSSAVRLYLLYNDVPVYNS